VLTCKTCITRVWQSTILDAPIAQVWRIVRPLDFIYNPRVSTVELEGEDVREDTVGGERTVYYFDATKQRIRLLELSDQRNELSWEVVSSEPAISVLSVIHTVRLRRVTETNKTFIEWTTDFSKDASNEVIEDARYKQKDNFAALSCDLSRPFSFRTTAEEALKGSNIAGKVVIITGANSGIGFETARVMAKAGAHVIAAVRDVKKSEKEFEPLRKSLPDAKIELATLDLNSFKSVRSFAHAFKSKNLPLHILICNAGIMALKERTLTDEKLEAQFGVNHVAHHLLVTLLLDVLKKSAPSRVVTLSSSAHRRSGINFDDYNSEKSYDKFIAYGQSKTANILFAKHLNAMMVKENVKVEAFAVHPGAILTNLQKHIDEKDREQFISLRFRFKTVQQGAASSIVAAVSPTLDGKGGIYITDCNETKPSPHASDMAAAQKLWELTEKIISAHP